MKRNRKAKILATLGPASSSPNTVENLFVAGADVFRLNFSHDVASTHIKRFKEIRTLEKKLGKQALSLNKTKKKQYCEVIYITF